MEQDLIFKPQPKVEMELAEDAIMHMLNRQPILSRLIEAFDLELVM